MMDCNVIIDHYRHIAVNKLDQNYVEKLKFGQNCQIHLLLTYLAILAKIWPNFDPMDCCCHHYQLKVSIIHSHNAL